MTKILKFGVEYLAPPLFNTCLEEMGHEELDELGLPESLLNQIKGWDRIFQETFCDEYPPDSGFKTIDEIRIHNEEGLRLCAALQEFFTSRYTVEFVPLSYSCISNS